MVREGVNFSIKNFATFPNSLLTFRKSKNVFPVFLGDLKAEVKSRSLQLGLSYSPHTFQLLIHKARGLIPLVKPLFQI